MKFNTTDVQILLVVAVLTITAIKTYSLEDRIQELENSKPTKVYNLPVRMGTDKQIKEMFEAYNYSKWEDSSEWAQNILESKRDHNAKMKSVSKIVNMYMSGEISKETQTRLLAELNIVVPSVLD